MSRVYDNWEKLVRATLRREQLRSTGQGHERTSSGLLVPYLIRLRKPSISMQSYKLPMRFRLRTPMLREFVGFNSMLRQGNITHHEYFQVGKGRDVGLNQVASVQRLAKDFNARNLQNQKPFDNDNPSAPPFSVATGEIRQDAEHIPALGTQCMPLAADAHGFSKPNSMERKSSIVNSQNNIEQEIPEVSVRTAACAESSVTSGSFHTRLPTFHGLVQKVV